MRHGWKSILLLLALGCCTAGMAAAGAHRVLFPFASQPHCASIFHESEEHESNTGCEICEISFPAPHGVKSLPAVDGGQPAAPPLNRSFRPVAAAFRPRGALPRPDRPPAHLRHLAAIVIQS